jgi:hypothetical protein
MTNAIKKYETVPRHKEMISDSLFHYITTLASRASEDSLVRAVTDWIVLGCYTSFRKSEWCSDNHNLYATIDDPNWGDRPNALPIIATILLFHYLHTLSRVALKQIALIYTHPPRLSSLTAAPADYNTTTITLTVPRNLLF